MGRTSTPDLKTYMDKNLLLKLNGNRAVTGVLRGYDAFMNVHLADAHEILDADEQESLGVVVIRGNSIVSMEALDPIK